MSQPDKSSSSLPADIADDPALLRTRLPGGVHRDDLEELLLQQSIDAGAALQAETTDDAWSDYAEFGDAYWSKLLPLRIVVKPLQLQERLEVVARFLAAVNTDPAWLVSGYIAARDGLLALDQVSIEPEIAPPPKGITSTSVREISLANVLAAAESALTALPAWLDLVERYKLGDVPGPERATAHDSAEATAAAQRPRRGRRPLPDDLMEWTARTYFALYRAGIGRGILVRLAELATEREGRTVTRETVRDWVKAARDRGFLEGATQGKAGARPGPRLRRPDTSPTGRH